MKNTNEPEDNLDNEGRPAAQPTRATDPKGQLSKVLQIGACDNEDSVAYTAYVENKLKFKNDQPTELVINEILNQDMKPPSQVHPQPAKSVLQQDARSKVPNFGAWEIGEGDVCDTECFDTVVKVNKNNRTVTPEPSDAYPVFKKGRVKAPKFVVWEEGDNNGGGYTAYLDNTSKKNAKSVLDPASVEPQPNQYLNKNARPSAAAGTKNKSNRGAANPTIPAFGAWNKDPGQAEGYTGAFTKAKEERNTPLNSRLEDGKGCFLNWARIPLLDEDCVDKRARTLGLVGEMDYGGGGRPTVEQKGGNSKDVGIASRGFPTSRTKHLQVINNDTPVSYNQQQKTGHCFPWFRPEPGPRQRLKLKFWK